MTPGQKAKEYCSTTIHVDETGSDEALVYNLRFMAYLAGWSAAVNKVGDKIEDGFVRDICIANNDFVFLKKRPAPDREWIPVSERLPEAVSMDRPGGWVLVHYKPLHYKTGKKLGSSSVFIARRIKEDDSIWDIGDDSIDNHNIHHWQPLPNPPTDKEDDNEA